MDQICVQRVFPVLQECHIPERESICCLRMWLDMGTPASPGKTGVFVCGQGNEWDTRIVQVRRLLPG